MSTKAHRRHLDKILPAIAAAALVALAADDSHATAQQVGQVSFNRLCPQLIGGDDEFNGNGPDVEAQVTLRRGAGGASNDQVLLDIYMHEMETRSDWTEGEIRRTMSLGVSPTGRRFTQIWAPGPSGAFQWTPLGNLPTYGTATLSYVDTDTTLDRFYNPQWWMSEIAVNGDTPGGDVGGCSADDSYMNVRLSAIWFWY
jgi:hypothetical protein